MPNDQLNSPVKIVLAVVVVLAIGLVWVVVHAFDWRQQAIVYATVLLGVVVIHNTAKRSGLRRHIAQIVLVAFTAAGVVIAIVA